MDAELQKALKDFERNLGPTEEQRLKALATVPDTASVITLTSELDQTISKHGGRCMASRLSPFLDAVQQFSGVIETFVASGGPTAALVWGSVKLVLQLATGSFSYFDKISAFLMRIGKHCPRFAEYKRIYPHSQKLQASLCNFYGEIVKCCTYICDTLYKPGWRSIVHSAWPSLDAPFNQFQTKIEDLAVDVKEQIRLAGSEAANSERLAQEDHRKTVARFIRQNDLASTRNEERRLQSHRHKLYNDSSKLLDELSTYDYLRAFRQARRACYNGTGKWLTEEEPFKKWTSAPGSSYLWIIGQLGCGKTILLSTLVEHLFSQFQKKNARIAFFFCRHDDQGSLLASTIVRSVVKQILDPGSLPADMAHALRRLHDKLADEQGHLQNILKLAIASSSFRYIIFDGLDDCVESQRTELLEIVSGAVVATSRPLKILFSVRDRPSRYLRDSTPAFEYQITNDSSKNDIALYVEGILSQKIMNDEFVVQDLGLPLMIRDEVVKGAQGMFLWAALQLNEICRQTCDADIREALYSQAPVDLSEIYQRILNRIATMRNDKMARSIFKLVTSARRPLTLDELREALAVEKFAPCLNRERLINDKWKIVPWCEGLLVHDEIHDEIRLAHPTVKQSFSPDNISSTASWALFSTEDADKETGEICTTYLNFSDFETRMVKRDMSQNAGTKHLLTAVASSASGGGRLGKTLESVARRRSSTKDVPLRQILQVASTNIGLEQQHPFLAYASRHWLWHTSKFCRDDRIWDGWQRLIINDDASRAFKPWSRDEWKHLDPKIWRYILENNHSCLLDLISAKPELLRRKDVRRLMLDAVDAGKLPLLRSLQVLFLSPVCEPEDLASGLERAVKKDQMGMIDLFMETICKNTDTARECCTKTMPIAAGLGQLGVVERLISAHADPNALSSDSGRSALQEAAIGGYPDVVDKLLSAGADVDTVLPAGASVYTELYDHTLSSKRFGRTALQSAAHGGYVDIVERLLSAGADVNLQTGDGGRIRTALQAASAGGNVEVVEKLLAAGADINASAAEDTYMSYGRTALQAAAEAGHLDVVEKLLSAGADVNAAAGGYIDGRTALQAAAERGSVAVVERLLFAGADVNAAPGIGSLAVVERLLSAGADVNAAPRIGRHGLTALQAAAKSGSLAVVERLLSAGADVNAAESFGLTALQAAAEEGSMDAVERLLAAGADVNAAAAGIFSGRTALQAGAQNGHVNIVKRLLSAGADVNAAAAYNFGRTALQAAAEEGYLEVVNILLSAGANVNAAKAKRNGVKAISAAVKNGHLEVVGRLKAAARVK